LQMKKFKADSAQTEENIMLQVVETLHRINYLWRAASILFNTQESISLQIPKTTLNLAGWIKLTEDSEKNIFDATYKGKKAAIETAETQARSKLGTSEITGPKIAEAFEKFKVQRKKTQEKQFAQERKAIQAPEPEARKAIITEHEKMMDTVKFKAQELKM